MTRMDTMFTLAPIGVVRSSRAAAEDDRWDSVKTSIELSAERSPDALAGLEEFSHAEVFFVFDRVDESSIEQGARHPRGNRAWPRVGILAQRRR